jgi:hypothetical protein
VVVQVQNEANFYQIPQWLAKLQLSAISRGLSPGDRDDLQALQLADPRTATTMPPAPKTATRQR